MDILNKLAECVEFGKINKKSPYPPNMKDQDGADELTVQALEMGIPADDILKKGLVVGMEKIGIKFRENKVFVPQVLMSAKAMTAATEHLKPYFLDGSVKRKGVVVMGTVAGDLHDIGKNIVAMMFEGNGWEVHDLGTDVKTEDFLAEIEKNPDCIIGMSALLTTTMLNMEKSVNTIKEKYPEQKILIGGAPITDGFREKIGADFFSKDPQGAVEYLNNLVAV